MDKTPAKKTDYGKADDDFLRSLLAAFHVSVETRGKVGAFGEITLKLTQKNGRIEGAKILEEAIMRPGES